MTMNGTDRRRLRALAQPKKTSVRVGKNGIGDGVVVEIETALAREELIKIYWKGATREDQANLADRLRAELVGQVGGSLILYRPDPTAPRLLP